MKKTKLTAILILGLFTFSAVGQINVKDSIQTILQNETIEILDNRFVFAHNLIFYYSSPKEAEELAMSVMYPFVQKMWETQLEQLSRLARLQLLISFVYRERGGDDKDEREREYVEKAIETARKSGDDAVCARCHNAAAFMEIKRGDVKQAHEQLYRAISYFDKMEQYTKSSEMLYVIVSNFLEIKDTDGMLRVLQQMAGYLEKDMSKQSQYQYNVVKHHYLGLLLEQEKNDQKTVDYRLADSMLIYIRKNIDLVENYLAELSPFWMHAYAYFYLAKELDEYYPQQIDTIFFYLDKAVEMFEKESFVRRQEANSVMELKINLNTVRAKALSRKGKTQEAYKFMREALTMLDELSNYKNLSEQRYTAYQFMADYYEKTNKPAEALKYQKLLRESEAQRYESEKIQAINDMSAKYETEKKEIQIQTLIKEKKTAQRILWLIVCLSLALLASSFLVIVSSRLKRKNAEQQLYETALSAELRQNELEKMQNLKQQLEQNPVQNSVEKIAQMVSDSLIEKDAKATYLERLSKIDTKLLEQAYQTSKVKLTAMDMKYIICFSADIDVKDISLLFNIEPASVHTVRYRIRKKFSEGDLFRVVL